VAQQAVKRMLPNRLQRHPCSPAPLRQRQGAMRNQRRSAMGRSLRCVASPRAWRAIVAARASHIAHFRHRRPVSAAPFRTEPPTARTGSRPRRHWR
jgi:hypothetical protein